MKREKTGTGLEFIDITTGKGPKPAKGFQVAVNYIAMTADGKVFDSYDIRCAQMHVLLCTMVVTRRGTILLPY